MQAQRDAIVTDKLQWTEPTEITEQTLRDKALPGLRKMFRQCTLYMLMAGTPIALLCYFVNPAVLVFALPGLALMIFQIPLLIWLNIRQARKIGVRHHLNLKGIQVNHRFYFWRQVDKYNFSVPQIAPDIGGLNIKLSQRTEWQSLYFYRRDIDEQELRAMVERFAPTSAQPKM